jgi:hypothetical protein
MDHEVVVREKMTEKYLLNELEPEVRDQFEEHFFGCQECALDVRAAAEFVERSKGVLAEERRAVPVPAPAAKPAGLSWWQTALRPAFAVPVMAVLLAVVGYQNLVTLPHLALLANSPQILRWASINVSTRGGTAPVIVTQPGKGFLLFVNIPPERGYARYTADLYNPAGKLEWTLTIPADSANDALALQVPGANRAAGTYTLAVRGVTAAGGTSELGHNSFELQIQK